MSTPSRTSPGEDDLGHTGPAVVLRPIREEDLAALAGGDSPFDDFGPKRPREEVPHPELHEQGGCAVWAADTLAGMLSWIWVGWGPNRESRNPMIGVWLRPEHRGRGIGWRAQRLLADTFFRHTTINRLEAATDVDNVAEQRALVRAGFAQEGRIRGAQWRDGVYRDQYLYSQLRAQWQDHQA